MKKHLVVNLLIVQRSKVLLENRGYWKLPGGHVGSAEDPREAVLREAREELGIEVGFQPESELFEPTDSSQSLPTPYRSFAHEVAADGETHSRHVNVILTYLLTPKGVPMALEGQEIEWFSKVDLDHHAGINDIVRAIAKDGLLHFEDVA